MAIGKNVNLKDKLIKRTVKTSNTNEVSNTSKASITNITNKRNIKNKFGQPSVVPGTTTYKTKKMTFYVKDDLLKKLYNYAYWDRHSVTESFNIVMTDGLEGKNTKEIKK